MLITGSAGFLGEATLDCVTAADESTLAICMDTRQTNGPLGETRRFISITRDIREPLDSLFADYSFDTVIHLAFMLRPPRDIDVARKVNVDATNRLLKACAKSGVRQIVYLSSATVYGAHPEYERPYTEADIPHPVEGFSYSEHKVEAENLLLRYAEEHPGCAVSILRGCIIMAPGANNFITDSLGMRFLPVPSGTNPAMQFLHIKDYASAIDAVLRQRARGIYNIAGSGTMTWRETVEAAGGTPIPAPPQALNGIINLTWKFGLQQRSPGSGMALIRYPWLVSTQKIKDELGWRPEHSSHDAVKAWTDGRKKP